MKFTPQQVTDIKQLFMEMNSKDDFLRLLNLAKQHIYRDKFIPFTRNNLITTSIIITVKNRPTFLLQLKRNQVQIEQYILQLKD